jgi:hypothetical protein
MKEVSIPKFDFGYPNSRKHEVIGKIEPVVIEKVIQENKTMTLSAPKHLYCCEFYHPAT